MLSEPTPWAMPLLLEPTLWAMACCGAVPKIAHRGGLLQGEKSHLHQGLKCRTAASAIALPCSCTKCPASGSNIGSGQPLI